MALQRAKESEFASGPDDDLVKLGDGVVRNGGDAER